MYSARHRIAALVWAACLLLCPITAAGAQGGPVPAQAADTAAEQQPFDIRRIDPETFHAIAVRIPEGMTPEIDGRLDDEVWQLAPVQGDFVQREPRFGQPATEQTEFRILYDERRIYFGVWLWDSDPSGIIGNEMKRDSGLRRGDQLKISIDTFHDHRNAFYFSTNPLGALKDAHTVENGRTINYDFNVVYQTRTSQDDKGWYVEIAIPFSQLRFKTAIGETSWGFNLCRILMRRNEESYWVPFPREWGAGGFARVSNAGVLLGLQDMRVAAADGVPALHRAEGVARLRPRHAVRRRRQHGWRLQAGIDQRADRRLHLSHRLRASGSRPGGGQPHPLQPVLPRAPAVLHRERRHLRLRTQRVEPRR